MIKKTKDYDIFIFRDDNRERIDHAHVARLTESIRSKNMLDLRPLIVNDEMEIIDGQHRLLAAKNLGAEVYYTIEKKLDAQDIIKLNVSKAWTIGDYLNFYCHHQYDEYLKLKNFMHKHKLTLKVAINICMGESRTRYHEFRMGEFVFDEDSLDVELDVCWETIHYIKKMNGFSPYTASSRFWKALLRLTRHPDFDSSKWKSNMQKMVDHFTAKAGSEEYVHMFQTIYNWKSHSKINLMDDSV